jgi:signal transduction histidine kinase
MSPAAAKTVRLLLMEVRLEHDVVLCRQRARQFAAMLGFGVQEQIRVATALSEIARNAFQYAGGGRVEFSLETEARFATPRQPQQSLVITVRDSGPGIGNLDEILGGAYRSRSGLGLGVLGAQRLMDRFDITTSSAGTSVVMRQILPVGRAVHDPAKVQAMADELLRQATSTALEEMQLQNQALIRAVEEAREREEEIQRINHELAETNSGVLALYDELETLHRVSVLMASQLDLRALIQAIIDVTTDLTNADLGAFYFPGDAGESWNLHASAGPAREQLAGAGTNLAGECFGADFAENGLFRTADLAADHEPSSARHFARKLEGRFDVRACLVVPVVAGQQGLLGAMIFAAKEPGRFTERSERIVTSIAAQAVVGIEKSRLFHAVKAGSEAKDQFLAMLSHELRTPLNPVLAIISSWQGDERIPEELRAEVSTIARNVRLEARLIDDLLDFNKLLNGKLQIEHAHVDVHGVIESAVDICRADLEEKRQHLEVNLAAAQFTVSGDAARLQQVLWNVIKNAVKFTDVRGAISIRTSNPGGKILRIAITDNGRGIEAESLARIFGAFEQGQPQILARFGGLGLGLAIAKTFVERHNGKISATSAGIGQGAEFTIDLPLETAPAVSPVGTLATPPVKHPPVPARILLVEDHPDTLGTLSHLLARKGHSVMPAATGGAACEAFSAGQFDLIISDLGLPDCSGHELLTRLRAIRFTPAIALSGYGMEADLLGSKAAGFEEHLTKPIDFDQLMRTVDRLAAGA